MSDRSTLYQKLEYSVPNSFHGKARDPSQTLTLDCALKLLLVIINFGALEDEMIWMKFQKVLIVAHHS